MTQFCYRSVPILRYFQHLIKPVFFNTPGRLISYVIALALELSYFVHNHRSIRFLQRLIWQTSFSVYETCKPHSPVLTIQRQQLYSGFPEHCYSFVFTRIPNSFLYVCGTLFLCATAVQEVRRSLEGTLAVRLDKIKWPIYLYDSNIHKEMNKCLGKQIWSYLTDVVFSTVTA